MKKIETILENKFKESLYSMDREELVKTAEYLLERVWNIPTEREKLIESISSINISNVIKEKPKPVSKEKVKKESEPKPEPEEKAPEQKKAVTKKKPETKSLSDEELARIIANELRNEPDEIVEIADMEREPTANVQVEQPPFPSTIKTDELKEIPLEKVETEENEMMG